MVEIIVFILIAIISFYFLALVHIAEVSFFNLSIQEINRIKKREKPNYKRVLRLIEKPQRLLASLYLAQLVFLIITILSVYMLASQVLEVLDIGFFKSHFLIKDLLLFFALFLIIVIFGMIVPRVHASNNRLGMGLFAAIFMGPVDFLFGKFGNYLAENTSFISGKKDLDTTKEMTTEELHATIEEGRNHAATIEEVNIFKSILKFDEIQVKQIMKPRTDIIALKADMSMKEVKAVISEYGYSRMPVYEDHLDKLLGIIHTKDLLPHTENDSFDWNSVVRNVLYVPEAKYAESLLKEFQQSRNHIAIVVDEFGGTSGLVTLEDIMEEIIGDIQDEFDDDEVLAKKIDDHNFIFEGKAPINDACRFASLAVDTFDEVKGESDSIAGLLLELAGKFPLKNEQINFDRYQFTVLSLDNKRIAKVKMHVAPKENDDK